MIDFNSIKGAPRQLLNLLVAAVRNSVGMRGAENTDTADIERFEIVQLQAAGTREVLLADSMGGPHKAAGPYGVSHSRILQDADNGWVQCYGETWIQMSLGLNVANVKAASLIYTSADPGHGDIVPGGNFVPVALSIDSSMYLGTTEANSQIRVMLLRLQQANQNY